LNQLNLVWFVVLFSCWRSTKQFARCHK
jgi:hypothetical protein